MNLGERHDATAAFGVPIQKILDARAAYESEWKSGSRPKLESYLEKASTHERGRLLQELLTLEIDLRRQAGENPKADDYLRRFPGDSATIGILFGQAIDLTRVGADPDAIDHATFAPAAMFSPDDSMMSGASFGDYELLGLLGRGGMGEVYRARQRSIGRTVALKVIRPDFLPGFSSGGQTQLHKRFEAEAHAAAQLEHENIVAVYEVGVYAGRNFYAMRLIEGRSLTDMVQSHPLAARKAAEYMEPVARAVAYAHARGILHRDIKPRNILLDSTDRPYVTDFGLAKEIREVSELTKSGEVLGTPSYIAPEQARDSAHVGPPADIYSLGATLYHLITGRPPFQSTEPVETLRQVLADDPVPPRRLNPTIDRDLETICLKCLEKEPHRRYASADLLADDLKRYLGNESIVARPLGPVGRGLRWCVRNPLIAALVLGIGASLFVTASVATIAYFRTSSALAVTQVAEQSERDLRKRATAEKLKAEASFSKAYQTANKFLFDFDWGIYNIPKVRDVPEMRKLRQRLLSEAADSYAQMLEERPDDDNIAADLAETCVRLADVSLVLDDQNEGRKRMQQSFDLRERLHRRHPENLRYRRELGLSSLTLSEFNEQIGELATAETIAKKACDLLKVLPSDPAAQAWAAESRLGPKQLDSDAHEAFTQWIRLLRKSQPAANWEQPLRETLVPVRESLQRFPKFLPMRNFEANLMVYLRDSLTWAGKTEEAKQLSDEVIARWTAILAEAQEMATKKPNDADFFAVNVCMTMRALGYAYQKIGDFANAEKWYRKAIENFAIPIGLAPKNLKYLDCLGETYYSLRSSLLAAGRLDDAIAVVRSERDFAINCKVGIEYFKTACGFATCANAVGQKSNRTASDKALEKSLEDSCMEMLQGAISNGLRPRSMITTHPDLVSMKHRPEFVDLVKRIESPKSKESKSTKALSADRP